MGNAAGTSRRAFCGGAATLLLARSARLHGQAAAVAGPLPQGTATRPDVAAIDHDRILEAARRYVKDNPTPLTTLPCARSPGAPREYYSEAEADPGTASTAKPFRLHADALFALGLQVPALAAAYTLTGVPAFAAQAAAQLRAWFVDPATSMVPRLDYAGVSLTPPALPTPAAAPRHGTYEGILETLPLAEIAQAIPFLAASGALTAADLAGLQGWFAAYLHWLAVTADSGPRLGALARDRKDHHGTSWLLQVCAYTLFTAPENGAPKNESNAMDALRRRFRTVTLRAQISADGLFPHELTTDAPYRNSLFNLDMLAAICHLLTTRFESAWTYELEDGPGVRAALAYHFPFIAARAKWPFRADAEHFTELPSRRESLLLAAPVYQRPEYAALWRTLTPDSASMEVLRTIPIHQPLLWVRQPPRTG